MNNIDAESKVTDFDFLEGRWKVHHRRLKERLVGCTEWEEFADGGETWETNWIMDFTRMCCV